MLVRLETAASYNKMLRWVIGIWIAQLAVYVGMMTALLGALKR